MKQTNNAIKFLLAQYRAIFKSAYFKGLATAVVVTAGLAATQAQAVGANDPWYSEGSNSNFVDHPDYLPAKDKIVNGRAAGAIDKDSDGIVSGGTLNIGSMDDGVNDFESSKNHVNGGYVSLKATSSLDAIAQNNSLNLNSGASIQAGSGENKNAIGGWAKTLGTGVARAENNQLFINNTNVTVSGEHIGAWASSIHGATAVGNSIELGDKATDTLNHYVSSGSGGFFGAKAFVENTAVGGDFVTQGNTVDLDYVDVSGGLASRKQIFGGYTYTNPHALASGAKADSMQSIGNTVDLNHMTFGADSDPGTHSGLIVANGVVSESDNGTSAYVNGANGSLTLSNSTFYVTQVAGGYASVKAGSATVENNTVEIVNSSFLAGADDTSNAVRSGVVESTIKSGSSANLAVINNTLSYTHSGDGNNQIVGSVEAAKATLNYDSGSTTKPQSGDIWNSSIQLKGNSATIGENITVSGGNVVGAVATVKSNSAIQYVPDVSLEQNTVTFNGSITGDSGQSSGQVTAAWSDTGGTLKNNTVTINGSVTNGLIIAARAGSGRAYGNDTAGGPQYNELSNNSVKIESDAKIIGTDIYAAWSDNYEGVALGNTVTVQGQVSNGNIYGGAGADSLIDLASNSTLKLNVETAGTPKEYNLSSDNVNLAGRVEVGNEATLNVTGYFKDGKDLPSSDKYNTNSTTIASSATILNAGTIKLYGATEVADGASLHALSAGAQIEVNGDKLGSGSIVDGDFSDNALNKVSSLSKVGDFGSLKLSLNTLNSYLQAGQTYTDSTNSSRADLAGSINLASGGAIEFTDAVVDLSDLDYSNSKVQGKIQVETDLTNGGSIFRGDTINVSHKLATNGSSAEKYDDLIDTGLSVGGVVIEANTLNLGTSSLAGEKTENIKFGFAEVTSEVNFANGALSKTYTDSHPTDKYAGYRLATDLRLDAKQEVQNDIGTTDKHYHALTGTINGDVKVQTNGEINVINGSWTANDTVTLASGGSIQVGNIDFNDASGESLTENVFATDAILTLDNALDVDLSATTNAAINVSGSSAGTYRYDLADYGTQDAHDGQLKLALLDLRSGIDLIGDSTSNNKLVGTANINASNRGVILVDGANLSDILAESGRALTAGGNNGGILFSISSNAQLVADGNVSAEFNDFGSGVTTGIKLNGSGYFVADGLTLTTNNTQATHQDDSAYVGTAGNTIDFNGNIEVNELTITDNTETNKPSGSTVTSPYASSVTVSSGNVEIAKSLTVQNDTLNISGARFVFATDSVADSGAITVNNIKVAQQGTAANTTNEIAFTNGTWDATGTTFTLNTSAGLQVGGDNGEDINDLDTEAVVNINRVVANAGSNIDVEGDGNLTISTVDFSKLAANSGAVKVRGNLTIEGDASYTVSGSTTPTRNGVLFGGAGSIVVENNGHLTFGSDATTGAIIANGKHNTDTVTLVEGFTQIQNNGGEVELGLASGTVFSAKGVLDLKTKLFTSNSLTSGILNNGGVLNIGDAGFQGIDLTDDGDGTYTATWEQMKSWSDIETNADVTNSRLTKTNVTGIKVSDQVRGHYGALRMDASAASNAQVDLYGHTSLRFAEGNNGYFISNADGSAALGAKVAAGKSLTLIDGGKIGDITLADGSNGDTELIVKGTGETTIASIKGDAADVNNEDSVVYINGVTNVTAGIADVNLVEVTSNLTANTIDVQELAALNGSVTADTITVEEGTVFGGTVTAKNFTYETTATDDRVVEAFNGGKLVVTDNLKVANDGKVFVGYELTDADRDLLALEGYTNVTGTGYLETNVLDLNGGTLYVDPAYGEDTSLAAIKTFKADKSFTVANNVGNADGNIFVGKNAAVGIGTDLAGLQEAIDAYQEGGSLSADKYGSIMYLNGQAKLAANTLVALDSDIDIDTDSQFRQVREYTENGSTLLADMGLGDKTALIMSTNAFADKDGNKTGTAITFDKDRAVINNEGSVIILQGSFATGDQLNFFNDKGNNGIKLVGQNLEFFSENGFLKGVIEVGEDVGLGESLEVDRPHAYNIMHEASDPVVESLIAYGNRNVTPTTPAPETPEQEQQPDQQPSVNDPNADTGDGTTVNTSGSNVAWTELTPATSGSQSQTDETGSSTTVAANNSTFLDAVITTSHGAPAEAAARLAIYGGAVQAAMAATSSTTDAIAARMGVGNTANITMANNGQGAALWLAPVYKTHDSDSFDSQGLDYGVDMNLYGVALGADFEFMPGLKAGVMFNVGSGDADGQGNTAANNTSNDFDYWGAAIYG